MNTGALMRLRRRILKQFQRSLTIYVFCCGVFVLFLSHLSHGSPQKPTELVKRAPSSTKPNPITGGFPRKIWQSWKVDPLDFEERDLFCARSWVSQNPEYRYEVLTDSNAMQYVATHFGPGGLNRPDIVEVYESLTAKIIKADLLRYLVMYVEGGVYVDIDVEALKPIERFIPHTNRFQEQDMDMIIGIEIDQPQFVNHSILGPKSQSFCQWTFACKPRLRVMLKLIDNIINWLQHTAKEQGVPISEINLDFDDVISGTGPSAFTQAILAEMSLQEKKAITWDDFHDMVEARVVGRVLVLTVEAFAAGQGHSDSGTHNSKNALVKHHYHASGWPTLHPRYSHPVYGEVEACNWDPLCVQIWDANKAAFDSLPQEEQLRQIEEQLAAEEAATITEQPEVLVHQMERRGLEVAPERPHIVKPTVTPRISLQPSLTVRPQAASSPAVSPSVKISKPIPWSTVRPSVQPSSLVSKPTVLPSVLSSKQTLRPSMSASVLPSKPVLRPSITPSVQPSKQISRSTISASTVPSKPISKSTISPSVGVSKPAMSPSVGSSKQVPSSMVLPSASASKHISRPIVSPSISLAKEVPRPTVLPSVNISKQISGAAISPSVTPSPRILSGFATVYSKPSAIASKLDAHHSRPHPFKSAAHN